MNIFKEFKEQNAEYVTTVRNFYKPMDLCHDEKHFDEVYNEAILLGSWSVLNGVITLSDYKILLAAAAYHDVGRSRGNKLHDKFSCDMIDEHHPITKILYQQFSHDEIQRVKETITAHRKKHEAKDEISKILKDADKISRTNRERALYRFIGFNLTNIYIEKFKSVDEFIAADQEEIKAEVASRFEEFYNRTKSAEYNMHVHNSKASQVIHHNFGDGVIEPTSIEEMDRLYPIISKDLIDKINNTGLYTLQKSSINHTA